MKILLLNQAFYPDVVSSGQYASDLAEKLAHSGHQVTALVSRRAYDSPDRKFPKREKWRGVSIRRIRSCGWGKTAKWRRALDFGSFLANCFVHLLVLPKYDVVVAFTSPPLIAFLGALAVRLKGGRLVFWILDLNPDQAVAAGWLDGESWPVRVLDGFLNFSLQQSHSVVALDRFMAKRVLEKGVASHKVSVIPPWAHDHAVQFDPAGRLSFREAHGLSDKFVVMYSGNHSPCHPLDTLLASALQLRDNANIHFCFIGGGSEFMKVLAFSRHHGLQNILCLPYQPLKDLSASLSAADLHSVVMGDPFVGIVHPSKVYNILNLQIPYFYIGPEESHVAELEPAGSFRHGDSQGLAEFILQNASKPSEAASPQVTAGFTCNALLARMVNVIERSGENKTAADRLAPVLDPNS